MTCERNRNYQITMYDDNGWPYQGVYSRKDSLCSPRINGKLVLIPNEFFYRHEKMLGRPIGIGASVTGDAFAATRKLEDRYYEYKLYADTRAAYKFRDKVRGRTTASLGITITQWKSSHVMLRDRLQQVKNVLDTQLTKLESLNKKGLRRYRRKVWRSAVKAGRRQEPLANVVLEHQFGWKPLIEDIHNAFEVLSDPKPVERVVSVRSRASFDRSDAQGLPGVDYRSGTYTELTSTRVTAKVVIENYNQHLASQLGFLNVVGVVWDAIPWSFLVNMFSNVGTIIRNLEWSSGCQLSNVSTTTTRLAFSRNETHRNWVSPVVSIGHKRVRIKERRLELPPVNPKFELKMPELKPDTLIVLASLVLQRFDKINKLLSIPTRA